MDNLDDLYQLLVLNQKKQKSAELKMAISFLATLGGLINPVLSYDLF